MWTLSIHSPERSISAVRLLLVLIISVSKRPTSLVEAAYLSASAALPPTTHRIAGSDGQSLSVVDIFVARQAAVD